MKKTPLRRAIVTAVASLSLLGLTGIGLIDDQFQSKRIGESWCC